MISLSCCPRLAHLDISSSRDVTGPGLARLVEVDDDDGELRQAKLCRTLTYLNLSSQGCQRPLPPDYVGTVLAYADNLASLGGYPAAAEAVAAAAEEYGVDSVNLRLGV